VDGKKRRAADIGVDEFLNGAFTELAGDASDEDGEDEEGGSDEDDDMVRCARTPVCLCLRARCVAQRAAPACATARDARQQCVRAAVCGT
jgi:hypothetical protein